MRKSTALCLCALCLFLVCAIGTTYAAWKAADESVHVIDTAAVKAQIVEEYETASGVYPGDEVNKTVNVKNTGSSDALVRVKVEKAWGNSRDEGGKLIVNDMLSTDNILTDYDTDNWQYDSTDGYFYYKGVLKPGETTLSPLFKEFVVDPASGNEYQGLTADILIKMECVQAAHGGSSLWGKTLDELNIVYTPEEQLEEETKVSFVGGSDAFVFDPSDDLFSGFKNLTPGESRSQTIVVTNDFNIGTGVEIFLRAEDINQSFNDPETLELVTKLLHEYATIIITDDNGNVIYNGPIWGEPDKNGDNPDTMRYDISLGMFATGESKKLNIQLQIDPAMDNEYQNLLGLIKWVWSAQDTDYETVTISGAKTWQHGANPVNERPKQLVIHVKADGEVIATQTITTDDHWCWSFRLPRFDKFGEEINYTIDEEPISGYSTVINGTDVINTHETYEEVDIIGSKTWEHRSNKKLPQSIIVHVKTGGVVVASKRVSAADNWQWAFSLPKYDSSGKLASYTVEEESVAKYSLVKQDGFNLTNRYIGENYPGDVPKTGDNASVLAWAAAAAVSALVLALALFKANAIKRKKQAVSS